MKNYYNNIKKDENEILSYMYEFVSSDRWIVVGGHNLKQNIYIYIQTNFDDCDHFFAHLRTSFDTSVHPTKLIRFYR